jgi:capsular exopolysaccharide synthesis family protein
VNPLVTRKRQPTASDRKRNLITYYSPDSLIAEQFRSIRANIHFSTRSELIRTFLITSPNEGEGKSTTIANLAVSMAQQNERILLIDANLRRPTVHLTFKISNNIGLSNVLTETESLEQAIHKTEIGQLDVLPSGPKTPFPSELFSSKRFEKIFANSLGYYDYILVDSPSILGVADTKILANFCDGVILVVNPGKTSLDQTLEAKKVLEFANSKITGVILNSK